MGHFIVLVSQGIERTRLKKKKTYGNNAGMYGINASYVLAVAAEASSFSCFIRKMAVAISALERK